MSLTAFQVYRRGIKGVIFIVLLALLFLSLALAATFWLQGGRWFGIQTASMAEYAPVGTLVLSLPVLFHSLKVGDMILFHPPQSPKETYFHRIYSITGDGIQTKGDISNSSVDPWQLHQTDLIGHEVGRVINGGWLLEALPIIVVGGIILYVISHFYTPKYWRLPVQVLGSTIITSAVTVTLKPLVQAQLLSNLFKDGKATISLVNTGILKLHAQSIGGTGVDLRQGQVGEVVTHHTNANGYFNVALSMSLEWWGWAIAILLLMTPGLICFFYALWARKTGADIIFIGPYEEDIASRVKSSKSRKIARHRATRRETAARRALSTASQQLPPSS